MAGKGKSGAGGGGTSNDAVNVLSGGRADDIYYISTTGVSVDEKKNAGTDTVVASVSYALDPNVENLTLEGSADLDGTGNELDNVIIGNGGSNTLSGLDGNDELYGGAGDDLLIGGDGGDLIDGGDGIDTARLEGLYSDYSFSWSGSSLLVTDQFGVTDVFQNVELFEFGDRTVAAADISTGTQPDPEPVPAATDDSAHALEDTSVTIDVLANDTGSNLEVASVTQGSLGTVSVNADQTVTYTPFANSSGSDSFSYTVTDSSGNTSTAWVTVTVAAVNDAPSAVSDYYVASEGAFSSGNTSVLDNDLDQENDTLTVVSYDNLTAGGGSILMNADGSFEYTAASGFTGTDTFSYTVGDGYGGFSEAIVSVDVAESQVTETPYYVTGVMRGETVRLNPDEPLGTGVTVYYAFAESTPDYYYSGSFAWNGFEPFTDVMRDATRQALLDISDHTDITFVETSVEQAGLVFGVAELGSSVEGVGYYPDAYTVGTSTGDLWLDNSLSGLSFEAGSHEYQILLHEIGHVLGLTHPTLPYEELNGQYTVMADHDHPTFTSEASSMLLYDIATLQYLYGANTQTSSGDDVYTFDALAESVQTIWDAGGHDVIDLSGATYSVAIDLNAGAFSTVGTAGTNNISIAFGTTIEDAIGGDHNDTIIGNDADNVIFGGAGNDVLTGGAGADHFVFNSNSGNDVISDFVNGEDVIIFNGPETSMADLTVTTSGDDLIVEHSGGSIQLLGVESLTASDFEFGLV